ncbi:MAG TPA: outer membrane lipoprotein carrier protein LolA [Bacteroidales bacterium]|nr:outer membrane lipoprotein carrier protein LolA [Bacteroidales bacterium]
MKTIVISLFLSMLSLTSLFAQDNATTKAKTILDNVSAKTKAYSTIKINYTLIHETKDNVGKGDKASGTLLLKGSKYQLTLLGNVIYCDGTTIWTHMLDEKEVIVANASQKDEVFNPAKMLTIYETGFKYKFIQERFEQNRAIYIIDLFPKEVEKSEYSRVRLYINKDKSQIWKVEYFAKDKNTYTIIVNSFETNTSMNDADFKFDKAKHPGVQIIDER